MVNSIRYFAQDFVKGDIASLSIGDMWIYFCCGTMIGYINQRKRYGFFHDEKLPPDGRSTQHLTSEEHIKIAVNDSNLDADQVVMVGGETLGRMAILEADAQVHKKEIPMTENTIPNAGNPMIRYFSQDPVDADISAFSVRVLWLYFYREILIGYVNHFEREGWFMRFDGPLYEDGFTSQHLLTQAHINKAIDDAVLEKDKIHIVEHGEMCAGAFRAVSEMIGETIRAGLDIRTD